MKVPTDTFAHEYVPGGDDEAPLLVLLHGTGGNERDLLDIGGHLWPAAPLLGLRGKVLENGMPRFFRRLAEGVFDQEDLIQRTHELANYLQEIKEANSGEGSRSMVAVGYSNGANIAASTLLLRPDIFAGALLLRAMVPIRPASLPDLSGKSVLVHAGSADTMIPIKEARELGTMLESAGASLSFTELATGHQLTRADLDQGSHWLRKTF